MTILPEKCDIPQLEPILAVGPVRGNQLYGSYRMELKRQCRSDEKAHKKNRSNQKAINAVLSGFNSPHFNESQRSNYIAYLNYLRDIERETKNQIASHKRRVLVRAAGEMFTVDEWIALCDRHDNCCARCKQIRPLTIDHVKPVSKGGSNHISNIQPLCGSCNSHKGVKDTDYRL